jgi:Fe-S-cluster containining protein
MNLSFRINHIEPPILTDCIQQLKRIYAAMDDAYDRAAKQYGFSCDRCRDNCCRTRFYHHTLIEYLYLKEGLMALSVKMQDQVKSRAITVMDAIAKAHDNQEAVRLMCPLNVDTRCMLYAYRPMICRLHGIPHELKKPGQPGIMGPGCDTFDRRCGHKPYIPFDRTPVYRDMAKLEQAVRQATRFRDKIRMTVSEMILDFHS